MTIDDYVLVGDLEDLIDELHTACEKLPTAEATPILMVARRLREIVVAIEQK